MSEAKKPREVWINNESLDYVLVSCDLGEGKDVHIKPYPQKDATSHLVLIREVLPGFDEIEQLQIKLDIYKRKTKMYDEEITKLSQALAVAEEALEDIGHDQDMIRIRGDLASEYNSWANEALEKIQCIKEGK